jgi:hypothetical protein
LNLVKDLSHVVRLSKDLIVIEVPLLGSWCLHVSLGSLVLVLPLEEKILGLFDESKGLIRWLDLEDFLELDLLTDLVANLIGDAD